MENNVGNSTVPKNYVSKGAELLEKSNNNPTPKPTIADQNQIDAAQYEQGKQKVNAAPVQVKKQPTNQALPTNTYDMLSSGARNYVDMAGRPIGINHPITALAGTAISAALDPVMATSGMKNTRDYYKSTISSDKDSFVNGVYDYMKEANVNDEEAAKYMYNLGMAAKSGKPQAAIEYFKRTGEDFGSKYVQNYIDAIAAASTAVSEGKMTEDEAAELINKAEKAGFTDSVLSQFKNNPYTRDWFKWSAEGIIGLGAGTVLSKALGKPLTKILNKIGKSEGPVATKIKEFIGKRAGSISDNIYDEKLAKMGETKPIFSSLNKRDTNILDPIFEDAAKKGIDITEYIKNIKDPKVLKAYDNFEKLAVKIANENPEGLANEMIRAAKAANPTIDVSAAIRNGGTILQNAKTIRDVISLAHTLKIPVPKALEIIGNTAAMSTGGAALGHSAGDVVSSASNIFSNNEKSDEYNISPSEQYMRDNKDLSAAEEQPWEDKVSSLDEFIQSAGDTGKGLAEGKRAEAEYNIAGNEKYNLPNRLNQMLGDYTRVLGTLPRYNSEMGQSIIGAYKSGLFGVPGSSEAKSRLGHYILRELGDMAHRGAAGIATDIHGGGLQNIEPTQWQKEQSHRTMAYLDARNKEISKKLESNIDYVNRAYNLDTDSLAKVKDAMNDSYIKLLYNNLDDNRKLRLVESIAAMSKSFGRLSEDQKRLMMNFMLYSGNVKPDELTLMLSYFKPRDIAQIYGDMLNSSKNTKYWDSLRSMKEFDRAFAEINKLVSEGKMLEQEAKLYKLKLYSDMLNKGAGTLQDIVNLIGK